MSETPTIDAFLNDPEFAVFVAARVNTIRDQTLAKMERLALPDVDPETGAKILVHYAYRTQESERPPSRSDMQGSRVWHAEDPLYKNPDAVIRAAALEHEIEQLWEGSHPKYRPIFEVLLLAGQEIVDTEEHARTLIAQNGFNWVYVSDRLKADPELAMLAIQHSDSVFSFIVKDDARPPITVDMAREAVARDPRMAEYVPAEIRPML